MSPNPRGGLSDAKLRKKKRPAKFFENFAPPAFVLLGFLINFTAIPLIDINTRTICLHKHDISPIKYL